MKKITTEARGQLNALKAEATKRTSSLQRDFANEKKKAERLTEENSRIKQELTTEKNTNKNLTREKSVIEQKLKTEEKRVRDLNKEKEDLQTKFTDEQGKNQKLAVENSELNIRLTNEQNKTNQLQRDKNQLDSDLKSEKEKYEREKKEEKKKLQEELEEKFKNERSELTRRAEEMESNFRDTRQPLQEKERLEYLNARDLHVITADDLASSISRNVDEISVEDLLCLEELEVNDFTYSLENLTSSENVATILRDFCTAASDCLGMSFDTKSKIAKKLYSIAELLNPEISFTLNDKTGWCVRHLEILHKKLDSLEQYLKQLDSNICTEKEKQNLNALTAWCFNLGSLAREIKTFLVTIDIEKDNSYDYENYSEYEDDAEYADISERDKK